MHACYMQVREFGVVGWEKFAAALLMSDRLDIWLPSGRDLSEAHKLGKTIIDEYNFIELIEGGIVRVGGRESNFGLGDRGKALFAPDGSELSDYLQRIASQRSRDEKVVLHPDYGSSRLGCDAIRDRRNDNPAYWRARARVNEHLGPKDDSSKGVNCVPQIVFDRANLFLNMEARSIQDPYIRECFALIQMEQDKQERFRLAATAELLRLSFEHKAIMTTHGADTHFALRNYATTFHSVANHETPLVRESMPPDLRINELTEILEFLLQNVDNNDRDAVSLMKRHKALQVGRNKIWDLINTGGRPEETAITDLEELAKELDIVTRLFGKDKILSAAGKYSFATLLETVIGWAIDAAVSPSSVVSTVVKTAVIGRRYQLSGRALSQDARAWPAIVVYGESPPTKDQIKHVLRDLQYRLSRLK